MKLIPFLLLCALYCQAQWAALPRGMLQNPTVTASGGGTAGPPVWYATVTNSGTSGSSITLGVAANANANPAVIVCADYYNATLAALPCTNSAGQTGLLVTNWGFSPTDAPAQARMWIFTNPPASAHNLIVSWTGAPVEWVISATSVYNQSSAFGTVLSNTISTGAMISNVVASAANQMVIGCDVVAQNGSGNPPTPTLGANPTPTIRSNKGAGASTECQVVWTKVGSTTSTNSCAWNDSGAHGQAILCLKGF